MKITPYTEGMSLEGNLIVSNMPESVYHSNTTHLSKSKLDLFNRSPAHLYCAEPRESTRFMVIGTAIHKAVLEPEEFKREYMLLTDAADRRSSIYKEAVKTHGDEKVLVASEINNVTGMADAALANFGYKKDYLSVPHHVELSFFGKCSFTGALIKCRFDMLTELGKALDLKKTQDTRFDAFSRSILNYRYHVQHAFYSHVYQCVTGKPLESFKFFAVEEKSPHSNIIYSLCDETKKAGHAEMMADLVYYASNPEPTEGIWQDEQIISLPVWYLDQQAADSVNFSEGE